VIWSADSAKYQRTFTRLHLTISRAGGKYWLSNGELDQGEIGRDFFWRLLGKYVSEGYILDGQFDAKKDDKGLSRRGS